MLTALLFLLAGCATGPSTAPRHYPALASAGQVAADPSVFASDPSLRSFAINCRAGEPALANALDDDCDGRIDGAAPDLTIAIAYPRTTAFSFALRAEGKGERPLAAPACEQPSAFCTLRIGRDQLGGEPSQLIARRSDPAQPAAALLVSVQSRGKVASYIAPPGPPEQTERALGRIAAP